MPENNQASDATKPEATDSSSTQPGSQAVDMNHTNAIVPHQISNHDKLVQTMVMVDGEWVNVNDTNDQKNVQEDMRKVNRVVTEAQKDIINAQNAADSAVKSADSAISASKVNSDAIIAQSSAISEAKAAADDAASKAQAVKENAASEAAAIRNQVVNVANNVSSVKADVASATSDVANLKVDVQANSAAIIKTNDAVKIQSKNSSDAINELKIANGQIVSIAKDAKNNATVAKQTADAATIVAQDAKSNAVVAKQTASSATIEATNATSTASKAELSVNGLTTRVDGIEGDTKKLSGRVTSTETILQQTKDQLLQKADKSVVDQANNVISQLSAEQKIMAGQIEQKASSTELDNALTSINKNTTAIDENGKAIKLKADATEVNNLKGTVNSHSASINLFSNQLKSMVTESKVNDIINGKGFATQSTVQSLIDQKAGTINESITNLEQTVKQGAENNVQLVRKSEFEDGSKGSWNVQMIVSATNPAPPAELGQSGMKVLQSNTRDAYEVDVWYSVKPGEKFDVDFWCAPSTVYNSNFGLVFVDKNKGNSNWLGIVTDHSGAWKHYTGTITAPTNAAFARPWFQIDKDSSDTSNTAWLAKPSIRRQNATTVAAIQQITASIDGLQSTVANKADKSQVTQLSNLVQSKVSTSDFTSKVSQLSNDINARVTKDGLLSQINLQAGSTLIQSGKIYLDAKSVVFGQDSKAFIPAALITNLTADQITTGILKSIQIDNGDGKFTVNSNGDVVANSIKLRNGQFLQGTIAGSTIYALNNDGVQDPKLAPKSDWYKITPNMIRWFNHYDQSVGQIGVGQGVITEGNSGFTGTPGLTISDSAKILLGTAQRTVVTGDEIGNLETTGLDWMSKTNLEITVDGLRVNLDPDQGNEYDGKGAEFAVQKDNKIGAYFGRGDHGNVIQLVAGGDGGNVDVNSSLTVHGSKNAVVPTSQGTVAINAYETAEYYFGDIGEDQTNGDGKVWASIDYLFGQTVNTSVPYQVFVTPYSSAHVWVSKRLKNRFLVESDKPNASFAWEIKAKRKGYEHTRLKNVDNMMEKPAGVK